MELHTDEPKVAVLWIAWQMAQSSLGSGPQNTPEMMRTVFAENYRVIAALAKLDIKKPAQATQRSAS